MHNEEFKEGYSEVKHVAMCPLVTSHYSYDIFIITAVNFGTSSTYYI